MCDSTVPIANATLTTDCVSSGTSRGECKWCSATNVCVLNSVTCPSSCASAPQDVCSLPPSWCHWCPQHNGRCKPLKGRGRWLSSWRREVECDTESWSATWSVAIGSVSRAATMTGSAQLISISASKSASGMESSSVSMTATITLSRSRGTRSRSASSQITQSVGSISHATDTVLATITLTDDHPSVTVQRSATSGLPSSLSDSPPTATDVESVSLWASRSATMTTLFTPTALSSLSPSLTRSLQTIHNTVSTTEHVCSCSGDIINEESVVLAAPDVPQINSLLIRMNSSAAMMFLNPDAGAVAKLTAVPQSRRAMWTARTLSLSLALQRHWSVDQFGRVNISGIETLCWQPSAAFLRGEPLDVAIARSQFTPHSDTVTWSILLSLSSTTQATAPSWLPPSAGLNGGAMVRVQITLSCTAGARLVSRTVEALVPVAGIPQELASEVRAASRASQLAAAFVSTGGASAAGRVLAMRAVVLCSSGDVASTASAGPLGLVVGTSWCIDGDTVVPPIHRGTIVGNAILLVVACCGVTLFALAVSYRRGGLSVRAALRLVAFPSSVYPVWVVVLPSTATAAGQLVALTAGCVSDALLVVVGVTTVVVPLGALWWLAVWAPSQGVSLVPVTHSSAQGEGGWWKPAAQWMRRVVHPSWEWVSSGITLDGKHDGELPTLALAPQRLALRGDHVLQHFYVLLADHRRLWYAALDGAVLAVVGALVAVSAHGPKSQCIAAGVLVAALYGMQLVACAALRPFTSLFGNVYGVFTLLFTFLAAVIQLSTFGVTGSSETADMLTWMSLAAAVCDLLTIGGSFVRTLLDVGDVVRVLRSLLISGDDTDGATKGAPATVPLCIEDDGDEPPLSAFDLEGLYWDADGKARLAHAGDGSLLISGVEGRLRDLSLM